MPPENKKFECKGCEFATANKCRLFHQSCAMMETLFWNIRKCLFKHMPERDEIVTKVNAAIDTCTFEGMCNAAAVKILVEKSLEDLLWLPKD
jgi:hypothetical protein